MVVTAVMVVSDSECSTTLPQLARRSGLACILTAGRAGGTDDHHNDETAALYGIISIYCSLVFVYLSFDSIICALLLVPRTGTVFRRSYCATPCQHAQRRLTRLTVWLAYPVCMCWSFVPCPWRSGESIPVLGVAADGNHVHRAGGVQDVQCAPLAGHLLGRLALRHFRRQGGNERCLLRLVSVHVPDVRVLRVQGGVSRPAYSEYATQQCGSQHPLPLKSHGLSIVCSVVAELYGNFRVFLSILKVDLFFVILLLMLGSFFLFKGTRESTLIVDAVALGASLLWSLLGWYSVRVWKRALARSCPGLVRPPVTVVTHRCTRRRSRSTHGGTPCSFCCLISSLHVRTSRCAWCVMLCVRSRADVRTTNAA